MLERRLFAVQKIAVQKSDCVQTGVYHYQDTMKHFEARWEVAAGKEFVDHLILMGHSGNGFEVTESPFGVTEDSRLDLRGFRMPGNPQLRRVTFRPTDFGAASMKRVWLERCSFSDSSFIGADFHGVKEHGSDFTNCLFTNCSFRAAAIGYRGSRFVKCVFDRVNFNRAIFVRPEFDDCVFDHCKLDGCDFNASSFEKSCFIGELYDVWFRGGFASPDDVAKHGRPRANQMVGVSFEKALLSDLTFSDGCELASVKIPLDGRYLLVERWRDKLETLRERLSDLEDAEAKLISLFVSTYSIHARTQDWMILNRDDIEDTYGQGVTNLIWQGLASTPDTDP